jgi:hypothetical protein
VTNEAPRLGASLLKTGMCAGFQLSNQIVNVLTFSLFASLPVVEVFEDTATRQLRPLSYPS